MQLKAYIVAGMSQKFSRVPKGAATNVLKSRVPGEASPYGSLDRCPRIASTTSIARASRASNPSSTTRS